MRAFLLSFLLIYVSFTNLLFAQDETNPWQFSFGTSVIDVYPVGATTGGDLGTQGEIFEDFFNISDHWNFGGLNLSFSHFLTSGLSIGIQGTITSITKIEGNSNVDFPYYSFEGFLKYNPLYKKRINPYIIGGYGYYRFDTSDQLTSDLTNNLSKGYFFGAGIGFKINKQLGILIESSYKNPTDVLKTNHFQHQIGITYNFSLALQMNEIDPSDKQKVTDKDQDGVNDDKDLCPDVPGSSELNGCPDSDNDTVIDSQDECPKVFGKAALNGCPDSDNDTVIDSQDECPKVFGKAALNGCPDSDDDGVIDQKDLCPLDAGSIELNGCPDSDGDTVPDSLDACPKEFGSPENNGCPVASATASRTDCDGDGIFDKNDKCPEISGNKANHGCPEISKPVIKDLNDLGSTIIFPSESAAILGNENMKALEKIKEILLENPNGQLIIEGHSSADGNDKLNKELSLNRAKSVKDHLIKLGIDANRLEIISFGAEKPIGDNESISGRKLNRRVQFKAKF